MDFVRPGEPRTPIIPAPPLLCLEVLSPKDRFSRMEARCQDCFRLGTPPEAWVFDPAQRTAMVLRPDGTLTTHREGSLQLAGNAIDVPLAALFAVLDEQ